jgi:hypothetical protein
MAGTDKKPKHDLPDVAPEAEAPWEEIMPFPWVEDPEDRMLRALEKITAEMESNKEQDTEAGKNANKVRQEMEDKISNPTDKNK